MLLIELRDCDKLVNQLRSKNEVHIRSNGSEISQNGGGVPVDRFRTTIVSKLQTAVEICYDEGGRT